ncbi:replication endonuclease [Ferrovum sp.]|uniref:replication endonuclease n=1 Tax=Ferrovum sp. TaxID=2609467 RepID=UPI0026231CE4|nr:replication endonuclease [Ferrovum sp.]
MHPQDALLLTTHRNNPQPYTCAWPTRARAPRQADEYGYIFDHTLSNPTISETALRGFAALAGHDPAGTGDVRGQRNWQKKVLTPITQTPGITKIFPAWLSATLLQTIDSLPAALSGQCKQELSDLISRAQTKGKEKGTKDWIFGFTSRLLKVVELQEQFRELDQTSGLSISTTDGTEVLRAADKMALYFHMFSPDTVVTELETLNILQTNNLTPKQLQKRTSDPDWWKRTLRQNLRERRERCAALIDAREVKWCSTDGRLERQEMDMVAEKWAQDSFFVNQNGDTFQCPTPKQQAKRQYAELQAKISGIAKRSGGDGSLLVTVTTPSEFHPTATHETQKGEISVRNHNWDFSTPKEADAWFKTRWARARAKFNRDDVGRFWVGAKQPHKDGTPHYHFVFFCNIGWGEHEDIKRVMKQYFKNPSINANPDADEDDEDPQLNFKVLEGKGGGVEAGVKYAVRAVQYVTRATGDPVGDEEALCTKQWACSNNFRRFSTSCSLTAAWKLARAMGVLPDKHPLRVASKGKKAADDFEKATKPDFGAFISEWQKGYKIYTVDAKNKYDENVKKITGIESPDGKIFLKKFIWKRSRKSFFEEPRTVVPNYQGGEAPHTLTAETERQKAREWLEDYSAELKKTAQPCATSKISDEEWEAEMKRWKKWKKRNRH